MGNLGCTAAFSRVQTYDHFTTDLQKRAWHYNSLMKTMILQLATKYNEAKKGMRWWLTNIRSSLNTLMCLNPGFTICTDSSILGWCVTDWKKSIRR